MYTNTKEFCTFDPLQKLFYNMENYEVFATKCVEELKTRQSEVFEKYKINDYERWDYDQATGLLTFSTGDDEINFRYFEVGTFSKAQQTWMWSWYNETTLDKVKNECEKVKIFGLERGYEKLTDGYFDSDEIEAWEFAAIATKITGGIGVYRPISDNILIFLVVNEVIDNELAQQIKDKYISCDSHGPGRCAFVCQHLLGNKKVGFEEAFETYENMELEEDDDFQAWCNECETIRLQEGEWNETSMKFADIKLVCEQCYFNYKEINLGHQ